uniref:Uncharacterized protein n=1 Tax=Megaselia scalaris TaxID=36166 RepID=T1GA94_MEGSC
MGEPPSSSGKPHDKWHPFLLIFEMLRGAFGGEGLSSTVTFALAEHLPTSFSNSRVYLPESDLRENGISKVSSFWKKLLSTLLDGSNFFPWNNHVTFGLGLASSGIRQPIGFPACTIRSLSAFPGIVGAINLGLAITLCDGSDGSPGPPLLTAITLNSYSSPSVNPGTVAAVVSAGTSIAFCHVPNLGGVGTLNLPLSLNLLDGRDGLPYPAAFLALTLKTYSLPFESQSVTLGAPGASGTVN